MKVISVCNVKGGVTKTVTGVHLGAGLAQAGFKVLLIDNDLQMGTTGYFKIDPIQPVALPTTAEVLLDSFPIAEAVIEVRPNLFVLPASPRLETADGELPHRTGGDMRLRVAFREETFRAQGFDCVLIDCPSGWAATTRNAMLVSQYVLMPINSEPPALSKAVQTEGKVDELRKFFDHDISLLGVLLTCCRDTIIANRVVGNALRKWPEITFESRIRRRECVNALFALGQTVYDRNDATIADVREDYDSLTREVIKRCQLIPAKTSKGAANKAATNKGATIRKATGHKSPRPRALVTTTR